MMISQKMADRLNEQVKNEFFSFWLYQSMAFALDSSVSSGALTIATIISVAENFCWLTHSRAMDLPS